MHGNFAESAIFFSKIAMKPPSSKNKKICYFSSLVHHAGYMKTEICWKRPIQKLVIYPEKYVFTFFSRKKIRTTTNHLKLLQR